MRLTVVLLLAALVLAVACKDVPQAWDDDASSKDALMTKSTMPVEVEAAQRSGKLAPNNDGKQLANDAADTMDQAADLITDADAVDAIKTTVVDESFNLTDSSGKAYMAFLADVDFHVNATSSSLIWGHPVLGHQQLSAAPATWLKITVTGDNDDRVDFFLRSDNLYISGFTNKHGTLFAFKVQGGQYKMPGSTLLSFGGGYPDFFGTSVGARGLATVAISKDEANKHLMALANYRGGADHYLKLPVAFFVLVIAEAERFQPIRSAVFRRWDNVVAEPIETVVQGNVLLVDLTVNWRVFSCAVLAWSRHGQTPAAWTGNKEARQIARFRVETARDALFIINPILQPVPSRCTWT